jgi:hypothetical protein
VDAGPINDAPTLIPNRDGPATGIAQVEEISRVGAVAVLADTDKDVGHAGGEPRLGLEHPDHAADRPA